MPAELEAIARHLESETVAKGRAPAARDDERYRNGTPPPEITCRSPEETNWLRNRYLHRSARLITELKVGMAGREDAGRKDRGRRIIPDDVLVEKPQDTARRVAKEKAAQAQTTVRDQLNQLKKQTNRALELLKDGARKGVETLGKYPPCGLPPF